jgi:alpha-1,3-glucosyltransferase
MVYVVMDFLEKLYLAGFPVLLAFVSLFPLLSGSSGSNAVAVCTRSDGSPCLEAPYNPEKGAGSAMEFLPLMLTSIYCAIGLVWSFLRLGFIYLNEETTYQGQLSELK